LPVEVGNCCQARRALVSDGPLPEELVTLLPDVGVDEVVTWQRAQSLEQGLVGESALETTASILDESIEDGEGAELAVTAAILPARASIHAVRRANWE